MGGERDMVKVGDEARDFTLKDQHGQDVHLGDLKGKKVLLSFHPLAFTPVCAEQMRSLEKNYERFEELNTYPLGLSVDSVPAKAAWAKEMGLERLKILSDFWPHGGAAKLYGIFREKQGFSERANIIIGEDGRVEFVKVYPIKEVPDIEEILDALRVK